MPILAKAIIEASPEVAAEIWAKPDIFQVEEAQQQILFGLADLLVLGTNDHSEDHIYPPLRPHQMTPEYVAAFFEIEVE